MLNLLADAWIPTDCGMLRPSEALLRGREVKWRRPDWTAHTVGLLSAMVQSAVVFRPELCEDVDSWEDWAASPPDVATLDEWLAPLAPAFDMATFMQCPLDAKGSPAEPLRVIPEAPGENTLKKSADIFSTDEGPRTWGEQAIALYAFQQLGAVGGSGGYTCCRGGSATTILLMPENPSTLWHTVWLNVLCAEDWHDTYGDATPTMDKVFPWMRGVDVGRAKTVVTPQTLHPLHVLWETPRRIRVAEPGIGWTAPGGYYYSGCGWRHPWAAYTRTSTGDVTAVRAIAAGYQNWSPYVLCGQAEMAAMPVARHLEEGRPRARLWMYGTHVAQSEALSWREIVTPTIVDGTPGYGDLVAASLSEATTWSKRLYKAGKVGAPYKSGKTPIRGSIYAKTEPAWYAHLAAGASDGERWTKTLRRSAIELYEESLSGAEPAKWAAGMAVLLRV